MKSNSIHNSKSRYNFIIFFLMLVLPIVSLCQTTVCPTAFINSASPPQTGCANTSVTFNATTNGASIVRHQWYNSNMQPVTIGTVSQHAITLSPPTQSAWTSSYTINLSSSATFYVAAACGTNPLPSEFGAKVPVTFTVNSGNTIALVMSPASNPADLCVGETITLTASGSSSYEWRINNPNDPSFTTGTTKTATTSGTYYLKGTDNCGVIQTQSIILNFKPNLFNVNLAGPTNRCQVTVDDQYVGSGSNVDFYTWSITDIDPAADASINTTGKATWNNTAADATVTMIAYGCHGTNVPKTQNVTVTRSPLNVQISTTQPNFCIGSAVNTKFNYAGSNITDYIWQSVSGTGNTIDRYTGMITWSPTFTGTATITGKAYGCGSSQVTSTATLTVFPNPTASTTPSGAVSIPFGTPSVSLSANTGSGYNYEWLNNDSPLGQTAATLSVSNTGSYAVKVVDANNCTAKSPVVNVTLESNYNYIISNVLQSYKNDNGTTIAESDVRNLSIQKKTEQVNFIDGLGKTMQVVTTKNSPAGLDLVQPVIYDAFDREIAKVLPVALGNTGAYKVGIIDNATYQYQNGALGFYALGSNNKIADDTQPFSKTIYEPSPLNRVLEQGSPGLAWQPDGVDSYTSTDKTRKFAYEANTAADVIRWTYTPPTFPSPTYLFGTLTTGSGTTPDYYGVNELYKNKTKDEDGNETIEYKDKGGKVVLKQVQAPVGWAMTYYIYDDLNNLVCVIAPEGASRLSTEFYHSAATAATRDAFLDRWAFRYVYDFRKRLSVKQVPGSKPVYMVFDVRNRVVLTQDGNQRTDAAGTINKKEWAYTKYDAFNRPIITGIYTHTAVIDQYNMQIYVNGQMTGGNKLYEDFDGTTVNEGYTNRVFPTTSVNLMSVQYFDNYTFKSAWPTTFNYVNDGLSTVVGPVTYTQPTTASTQVYGMPTGKKVKVLDGGLWGSPWLKTVLYYDDKSRAVQTISDNQKVGIDRTSNLYDFTGKALRSKSVQTNLALPLKDATLLTVTPTKLTSTNTTAGWGSSGAASQAILPASQNGWAETAVNEIATARMFGFSSVNTDNNFTTINYAIHLHANALEVYENGTYRGVFAPALTVGEVLRVERSGSTIVYKRNGTTFYTSTIPSTTQLLVDMSFYSVASTFGPVYTSFSGGTTEINRRFEYDDAGRLLKIWHKLNTESEILLALNEYNELGQLIDKKLHSTVTTGADAKQSIDYRYNIRGWLSSINDASLTIDGTDPKDYFGMELGYNTVLSGLTHSQLYNGNISATKWSSGLGGGTVKESAYTYAYDVMNRLQSSTFNEKTTAWATAAAGTLSETAFIYDLNGNIKALTRNDRRGTGTMDLLAYDYGTGAAATNRLLKVTDNGDDFTGFIDGTNSTDDYTYDANGNMTTDQNKGIAAITYNYLNLPETVSRGANTIRYIYDATGRKLSQVTTYGGSVRQVDYDGELQYDDNILQFINHDEGRIVVSGTKLIYLNGGDVTTNVTTINTALTGAFVLNGEKYLKAVSSAASSSRSGLYPLGGTFAVTPLARYKIRIKGFRDKGTAASSSSAYMLLKVGTTELAPGANLPAAVATGQTESWTEQIVKIPADVSTLQVGMVWSTVLNGEIMYINDMEITKLDDAAAPEYQYNLKDHLGNVRVTFTTKVENDQSLATLELVNAAQEQSQFIYYDEAVKVNSPLFDHTKQAGSNPGVFFYRGINLNGPATVIDGNPWVASATAANFTWTGGGSFENQLIPLNPTTDAARTTMLRASIYGDVNMSMTSVPNGTYDIYLSVWEDYAPQDYYINIEGVQRLAHYYSGGPGTWTRLGPFRTVIADGNITMFVSGVCNLSGLEAWTVTQAPGNLAPVVNAYLPDQTAIEGQPYSYQFPYHTFIDPDAGSTIIYSANQSTGSALPTWLTFNATTKTFSGTPTVGSAGYLDIRVTASDGIGGTTSDVFTLAVTSTAATTFYRGINLNGPATTIDANAWTSSTSNPNFSFTTTNGGTFENQAVTLIPATDASRATMIRSSIWGPNANLMATSIPSGIYDISLYVWEDNSAEVYNVAIEGQNVVTNYNSGPAGTWAKLGPFRRIINDGTLNISNGIGVANLSGIEIKTVPTTTVPVTAISISPSPFNVLIGQSAQMTRTISPANASNKNVLWTSSNTAVALVNNDGWVTGVSAGTATITATINGFSAQATANITNTPSSYSTRLNGTTNEKYGLAKSLSVMPGDVITMEVFAKYVDTNTNNWNAALTNLVSTIAAGTAPTGTFVDGGAAGSIGGTAFPYPTTLVRTGDTGTGPKAYLNYLIFDKNFTYKNGGFKRLSTTPKETGTNVAHERLAFDGAEQITITEAGYVYIYLSNENPTAVEVYFDDFKVTQTKGAIVSSQDYYPFGLTFNGYQRENSTGNSYKFNGIEEQEELGLNVSQAFFRIMDPTVGRWWQIDPKASDYLDQTPYNMMGNNPILITDPLGDEWAKPKTDEKIAARLDKALDRANKSLERQNDRLRTKLEKAEGNAGKVERVVNKIVRNDQMIGINQKVKSILQEMAKTGEGTTKYTFNIVKGDEGGTMQNRVTHVIEMGVTNRAGNQAHEVTHGWKLRAAGGSFNEEIDEVDAYKAQYSVEPSSMPPSKSKWPLRNLWDIGGSWVGGVMNPTKGTPEYPSTNKKYADDY